MLASIIIPAIKRQKIHNSTLPLLEYTFVKQLRPDTPNIFIVSHNKKKYIVKECDVREQEIDMLTKIRENPHDNLMGCIYFSVNEPQVTILMEQSDSDLYDFLKNWGEKEQTLENRICLLKNLYEQIISGLLHMKLKFNKVHLDLKADNILAFKENLFKITDYGFAYDADTIIEPSDQIPMYVAPEVSYGIEYKSDPVDIFSIASILYHVMSNNKSVYGVVHNKFMDASVYFAEWSELEFVDNMSMYPITTILKTMLDVDPKQRPTLEQLEEKDLNELFSSSS